MNRNICIVVLASVCLLFLFGCGSKSSSELYEETADPVPASLYVNITDVTPDGKYFGIPGTGMSIPLKGKPNLIICLTEIDGSTFCLPDSRLIRSRCPKTKTCPYDVERPDSGPVAISIFDLKNIGRRHMKRLLNYAEEEIILKAEGNEHEIREKIELLKRANQRRAIWKTSFILLRNPMEEEEHQALEALVREAVVGIAVPKTVDPIEGALSGPIPTCWPVDTGGWSCESREIQMDVSE